MLPLSIEQRRPSRSPEYDQSTLSNYKDFAVLHTDLNLSVSFEKSAISGSVTFQLKKLHEGKNKSDELHLDTSYLDVQEVHIDGSKADFQIEQRKEPLGSRLVINNASCNDNFTLNIQFRTTDKCTALQWLNSKQTKGGKPYVFSQLEAIHARSLFPCFDTPSVKSTFTASIESPLPVVFSGIRIEDTSKDTNIYRFEQKVPIPAYLIGIASGDLSSAPIGPRSTVYTEPFRLKDCQWEFENDVEKFIQTAEKIIFEYEWGTYDILVNVDSYPYGGMESPNMTFATPTLIAHDRSNIDVIAHELAHSWSGNLVTNCSWNHFWLNEGWTVYLERRIIGAIHGEPTRHFSALIGWSDLQNSIDSMKDPERFSTLVQNLNDNTDPDDAFSTVPYEKGFNLLFHLETILGGKAEFDPFIRHYFKKFAKKSLDTFQFLDTLYEFYPEKKEILDSVDWETWLYKPGMPPRPHFITALADNVYQLADKWVEMAQHLKTTEDFRSEFNAIDIKDFNSNQLVLFLETLTQNGHSNKKSKDFDWAKFPVASRALLDIYQDNIVKSQNAEVVFKMFKFQIFAKLQEEYKHLADWLGTVGRMKFVRPGYRLLNSVDRRLALATFDKFKDTYHPICKALVKQDLGL
ncbi:CFF_collapsed_G0047720.mRNA.1.CDS.1 [Saccharomyces cerevisiae]|uniref:Leukotriene A(4) hydrolase n=1 Tax=Saccharomyces cerevisiae x Saccharomyces kudriavzevii (strain VIN7) TaxID=1095631 RepID=H0GMP1_SACCK|nr:YNL045W-like protein [Saccharomyces cerevisiae x Saccharomyces kudriavzevii VIN7]KAJ1539948.1 bifunctional aminopeptidase/epoxide hydrolase [Saccharomyces cerevisiae]PTN23078.1 bifunctional aminopeptidase/epoxide hydrolase [Saccharomyces cerevisiae]PTN38858.1 bifunctional aminopeptidase/epoxide hydrolase [Saccharomyces cerevisiae]CAI4727317.1 AMP_1a_G0046450.mRNA.1.CDS.1 [Saccharomyces cerevisiae]